MTILGISAYYHDSAIALIKNGVVIYFAQEERFSRIKNDASFPILALRSCLGEMNVNIDSIDAIAFYDKPFLKFERILETLFLNAPLGIRSFVRSMPVWIKQKLFIKSLIRENLKKLDIDKFKSPKIYFPEHHLSHAASTFYPSNYKEALIITVDGVGEYTSTSICYGTENGIRKLRTISFPHSIGLLYASVTSFLGFKVNSGEYKVMGLASYGDETSKEFQDYYKAIKANIIDIKSDGSFKLNQKYFEYQVGLKMCNENKWHILFDLQPRKNEEKLNQSHKNLALAFQKVTEEILVALAKEGKRITKSTSLCLAGGVALNCVANSKVWNAGLFENIYVQPASGDAGGAIGAALVTSNLIDPQQKKIVPMGSVYLGPPARTLRKKHALHEVVYLDFSQLCKDVAGLLDQGKVVAWVQGRMELGPRALGNRSILADPRNKNMMSHINLAIKKREAFRPFAPVVLHEDASKYFDLEGMQSSSNMLFTFKVKSNDLPAITHIDITARVQTVSQRENEKLYSLLSTWKELTSISVLLNTSFNGKDEPIVCSSDDAIEAFISMPIDYLVVNNTLYSKKV